MNRKEIKAITLPNVDGRRLKSALKALNSKKWEGCNWYENTDNASFNETEPREWKEFFDDGRSIKYTWLIRVYEIWNDGCTMGYDLVFVPEFDCLKESVQEDIRRMCGLYPEDRPCAEDMDSWGASINVGGLETFKDEPDLDYVAMCVLAINEIEKNLDENILWVRYNGQMYGIDQLNNILK